MLEKIEDFRFSNRIPSRAEAIRKLIDEGLKHIKEKNPGSEGK
jgi:metal-responsive CopG/Arc/MetJ family transcriptional regulator